MQAQTDTSDRVRDGAIDKHDVFRRHALFRALTPPEIEFLATHSRVEHFRKGTTIFMKGDEGNGMMAALKGQIRIGVTSAQG